ncbi:MAG TPA: nitrilase-related carbon-nitrogen hydrolase [Chthoniobacterales bacterium]|nr:nitrilase-related carbon-nitrogen hydrolase [Chthoniobacterales bacterium]
MTANKAMKIAAAQFSCAPGEIGANLRKIHEFTSRAKEVGAELIVFPEMSDTGYSMPIIRKAATDWKQGAVPRLEEIAREFSIAIICGVSEREGDRIYNSQVFFDAAGNMIAKYRKTHLVTASQVDERSVFTPGDSFVSCEVGKYVFGLTICYDLRFPEVCRKLAVEQQVNVFVNSSAWPIVRVEHLRLLALTRAIENQCYLILANRTGADGTLCGTSVIIDPYGVILSAASVDREEIIYAEISEEIVNSVRKRMAVFDHRRTDLY